MKKLDWRKKKGSNKTCFSLKIAELKELSSMSDQLSDTKSE